MTLTPKPLDAQDGKQYRMFVDEVGNADLKSSSNPNHRYLSLTGIIVDMASYNSDMDARLRTIKLFHFKDESVILHRRDILDGIRPFHVLNDPFRRNSFNEDLLIALGSMNYVVVTVSIDKLRHQAKYGRWHFAPYHYCMTVLIERYVKWLNRRPNRTGDVMAESRNRFEDEKLKDSYSRFCSRGTRYENDPKRLARLSSKELKLSKKEANVNGLQVADIVASPAFRRMLCDKDSVPMTAPFGREVAEILLSKYDTSGGVAGIPG